VQYQEPPVRDLKKKTTPERNASGREESGKKWEAKREIKRKEIGGAKGRTVNPEGGSNGYSQPKEKNLKSWLWSREPSNTA